jgi:hypothetical protein
LLPAHELGVEEFLPPFEVAPVLLDFELGSVDLGDDGLLLGQQVAVVDLHEDFAFLDHVTGVDVQGFDLAADLALDLELEGGSDVAGDLDVRVDVTFLGLGNEALGISPSFLPPKLPRRKPAAREDGGCDEGKDDRFLHAGQVQ